MRTFALILAVAAVLIAALWAVAALAQNSGERDTGQREHYETWCKAHPTNVRCRK
jgi:hypothetical protein